MLQILTVCLQSSIPVMKSCEKAESAERRAQSSLVWSEHEVDLKLKL
jgi:hypothetical protein